MTVPAAPGKFLQHLHISAVPPLTRWANISDLKRGGLGGILHGCKLIRGSDF